MIAKIGRGENIIGALSYNQQKVVQDNGKILLTHKMIETPDGNYFAIQLSQSFEPYLTANRRTEKPVLHISLNPDPKDKVSDEKFKEMAQKYMLEMGYGNQPYVVFKHTDIERTHIHIVSVCVDEEGRKIPDKFEKMRSMKVCRDLERQYNLVPAMEQNPKQNEKIFQPVNYNSDNIKSQMASVIRHLPKYYRFHNLGTYNALLSLFNISVEVVNAEINGQFKHGLVYFVLNDKGEKASNPFKASLFGKEAGYQKLHEHFAKSAELLKNDPIKAVLKNTIEAALNTVSDERSFKKQLSEQGINTVIRRNAEGRIYGVTFIDHTSKSVWNGSQLGKNLSANVFNGWWNDGYKRSPINETGKELTHLPAFQYKTQNEIIPEAGSLAEIFSGLLSVAQGEDYEEIAFANRMKKKKKRKKKNN